MSFTEDRQNYYELLEIGPDATPQEIRTAYLRTKAAYKKDSPALYTLMDASETETLLQNLEDAYQVLSHPERRKEYDRSHGFISLDMDDSQPDAGSPFPRPGAKSASKIVSIDRVPPMEDSRGGDPLISPPTDFMGAPPPRPIPGAIDEAPRDHRDRPSGHPTERRSIAAPMPEAPVQPSSRDLGGSIAEEIARETEWKGITLRRVREARGVSVEELSEYTKISKTYLLALEEESFHKLPAPVFLRGFVIQVAKFLKLPHDKVATAYMARRTALDAPKK